MNKLNVSNEYLSLSHNLRIPLTEILGMTDMLSDTNLTLEQQHEVELIRQAGNRLLKAIESVLTLSEELLKTNQSNKH